MTREEKQAKVLKDLKVQFGDKVRSAEMNYDMPVVVLETAALHDAVAWLKNHPEWQFNHFIDITSVDHGVSSDERFEVVIHLRSHSHNIKVRLKAPLKDTGDPDVLPEIPTHTDLFIGALWTEREIFDLMGIRFTGHPRMTRLLSPDDFVGHPLRKDFPVKGQHRGSFPRGTVISNKRREPVIAKKTKPNPADQLLPNTPWEQKRGPMKAKEAKAGEGGDA
ncbi:MAG: NADH-quinone oxidoreductase subunit C [bacterium]